MMGDCIFCKIITKEVPAKIVLEDDDLIVFPDISPSADTHLLIVPKEHIGSIRDLESEHAGLLVKVYQTANEMVDRYDLKEGPYRVVVNGGKAQHIPHLHFHLLGGQWRKQV